jgi:hypothetical protein
MTMVAESKPRQKQRRSKRTIPFVSGEEIVLISTRSHRSIIGKMLDLSDDGTLVYLGEESDLPDTTETQFTLSLYHQGKVFEIESKLARRSSRLLGFEFIDPSPTLVLRIRAKIVQMQDWMRV